MILSDKTIKERLKKGDLVITPLGKNSIQPASVDCTLGEHFLVIDDMEMHTIEMDKPIKYREINSKTVTIPANSFLLATTKEYIKLPADLTAFVEGRSSIGRMGLFIQNAGWVDPGFEGMITLELYNANSLPIKLQAGRRIGQFVICEMTTPADEPYNGKYQGQNKTIGSRVFKDVEVKKK